MIVGTENLRDMFAILHDGVIVRCDPFDANLELNVEILYLAQRVNLGYLGFRVVLQNVCELSFTTWPSDLTSPPDQIKSLLEIFAPELDILGCEIEKDTLKVTCNQSSPKWNYCGGELCLKADSASVTDPGGKEYSIEELGRLSDEYWNEWQRSGGSSPAPTFATLVIPPTSAKTK